MIFKKIDILSPQITLYNKGLLYHTSIISIILSIFVFFLIILVSIAEFLTFYFNIDKPILTYNNLFVEEAGSIMINPYSFFHYININNDTYNRNSVKFDFENFRIVGLETYLEDYLLNKNLDDFNHWLYGPCDNNSIKEINSLVNQEIFGKSACIKKYYDLSEKKYIDINDSQFKWPNIEHGTANFTNKFYSILVDKCENETLNILFNDKKCKNDILFEDILNNGFINFYFIDQYIQNDNNSEHIKKYLNRIESKLSKNNYIINHLYFNPVFLLTQYNGIKNKIVVNYTFSLDRNDININNQNKENDIYIGYYLWLNKRMNFYTLEYMTFSEAISNIGGISNVIISVFYIINKIFNGYSMLSDSKELFFSLPKNITENLNQKKEIKLKNIKSKSKDEKNNIENKINSQPTINESEQKKTTLQNENNISYIDYKNNYKHGHSNILLDNNKDEYNTINNLNNNKKNDFNFCKYCIYKISFGKLYKNLNLIEDFRIKLISVESIFNNYLNIHNLVKVNTLKKVNSLLTKENKENEMNI